ncbi:hypothetical protein CLV96_3758 [Leptospira meyeri]|uniref:Uncharacterized protein n=1 Tax=Leptospira meyeri TaxID=29508 RepID=A0A4R8MK55_LEPME|nr:hypothetical protein [Leptospira meyeri]EKJ87104.1 hypothetical protein LEP1GSC017_0945 [Leptospira meyeri serovar Hardjo str. Went 5]PKA23395.1 hypothetical protein CH381_25910 [Leptospira sp. mixed culture ATI2-C-A1]TDY67337.1 hypothetical protein CLV96_3758 [Leptospira meyeri]TGL50116.1 hypothetical protein EHQ55_07550 [Leptospira meyeri]
MFEEEPSTLKEKIYRAIIALFLFILVGTLIITFLPGDAEQSLVGAITGQNSTKAGTIAGRSIPVDYFNAAKRDCYYRYQQYGRETAQNPELLNSCAFSTVKEIYIANDIAAAVGFQVSEISIKREMSRQAREVHKESVSQAGYGEEDSRSLTEIYQQIYRSAPMNYRIDSATGYALYPNFLDQPFSPTENEAELEDEAKRAKISFRIVAISEVNLLNAVEAKINISDEELKKEYEKEKKDGSLAKDAAGNFVSFESRKPLLLSKMKFDRKRKEVEIWKGRIAAKVSEPNALEAIASETLQPIETVSNVSLSDLKLVTSNRGNSYRLANSAKFWETLANDPFSKKTVVGPFSDNDKQVYVEFGALTYGQTTAKKPADQAADFLKQRQLLSFFLEINQSLAAEYNVEKKGLLSLE